VLSVEIFFIMLLTNMLRITNYAEEPTKRYVKISLQVCVLTKARLARALQSFEASLDLTLLLSL
jgi:hypothetical protein